MPFTEYGKTFCNPFVRMESLNCEREVTGKMIILFSGRKVQFSITLMQSPNILSQLWHPVVNRQCVTIMRVSLNGRKLQFHTCYKCFHTKSCNLCRKNLLYYTAGILPYGPFSFVSFPVQFSCPIICMDTIYITSNDRSFSYPIIYMDTNHITSNDCSFSCPIIYTDIIHVHRHLNNAWQIIAHSFIGKR